MKFEEIKEFYKKVSADKDFNEKVKLIKHQHKKNLTSKKFFDAITQEVIIPFARKYGFDFTAEELLEYERQTTKFNEELEKLDTENLKDISGGLNPRMSAICLSTVMSLSAFAGLGSSGVVSATKGSQQQSSSQHKRDKSSQEQLQSQHKKDRQFRQRLHRDGAVAENPAHQAKVQAMQKEAELQAEKGRQEEARREEARQKEAELQAKKAKERRQEKARQKEAARLAQEALKAAQLKEEEAEKTRQEELGSEDRKTKARFAPIRSQHGEWLAFDATSNLLGVTQTAGKTPIISMSDIDALEKRQGIAVDYFEVGNKQKVELDKSMLNAGWEDVSSQFFGNYKFKKTKETLKTSTDNVVAYRDKLGDVYLLDNREDKKSPIKLTQDDLLVIESLKGNDGNVWCLSRMELPLDSHGWTKNNGYKYYGFKRTMTPTEKINQYINEQTDDINIGHDYTVL